MGFFDKIGDIFEDLGQSVESGLENAWDDVWKGAKDVANVMTLGIWGKLDDWAKDYLRDPLTGRGMQEAMLAQQRQQMELQRDQMTAQRTAARRAEERMAAANRRAPDIGAQLRSAMDMAVAGGNTGTMLAGTKPSMQMGLGSGSAILGN
jgi:hypothetical protein